MADNRPGSNVGSGTAPMAGITITQPSAARLTTIKDEDSTHSITPPATAHDEKRVNIYTTHSYSSNTPPRSSMEVYKSESKTGIIANLDVDLEAGHRSFDANGGGISLLPSKIGKVCTKDPAWPSREDQKKEMLQMKRNRACCGWWAGLTTKKRNWAKTIIFFLVCGLLVGIAVSITRAVGGGVFSGDNTNKPIGGSS